MERAKRIGRPPKWGDDVKTKVIKAKMPVQLATAFEAEATKAGMTVQDYLGRLAEKITGVSYDQQGELPLTAA